MSGGGRPRSIDDDLAEIRQNRSRPSEGVYIGPPLKESPEPSISGALRSIGQGVSFNFGDEIEARLRSLGPETYDEAKGKIDKDLTEFRAAAPGKAFALEMGGGLLSGGAIAKGAGAGLKGTKALAKLAGSGAASGAVAGAGASEGSLKDRAVGGALGGTLGAGLGALASRAIPKAAGTRIGGKVASVLSQPVENVPGAVKGLVGSGAATSTLDPPPAIVALAKRLTNRGGQTVDDIQPRVQQFADVPESRILDVVGKEGQRHARGMRAVGGPAALKIDEALDAGHAAQKGSIESTMTGGAGRTDRVALARELLERQRANAQPLYQKAFASRAPIEDDVIAEILSRPGMQDLVDQYARNEAIAGRKVPRIYPGPDDAGAERLALQAGDDVGPARPRTRSGGLKNLDQATDDELAAEYKYLVDQNASGEQMADNLTDEMQGRANERLVNRGASTRAQQADADTQLHGGIGKQKHTFDSAAAENAANQRNLTIAKIEAQFAKRKLDPGEMYSRADKVGDTSFNPDEFVDAPKPSTPPPGAKSRVAPTLEGLDHAKKAIDAGVESAFKGEAKDFGRGHALKTARGQLLKRIDELAAGGNADADFYVKGRQTWAGDQASREAVEDGAAFMRRAGDYSDPDAIKVRLSEMTPAEKELAQVSGAREIGIHLNSATDAADLTKRLANDDFRERVTALWGDKAPAMLAKLDKLRTKADIRDFIKGNSQTADKLSDAADAAGGQFFESLAEGKGVLGATTRFGRDKVVRPISGALRAKTNAAQADVYAEPLTNQKALGALMREMERQRLLKNPSAIARGQAGRVAGTAVNR